MGSSTMCGVMGTHSGNVRGTREELDAKEGGGDGQFCGQFAGRERRGLSKCCHFESQLG